MATDTFDPALLEDASFQLNPYPVLKQLRAKYPVWRNPRNGMWYVTRYEDVAAGFLDHESLSSTIFEQSHSAVFGPSLTAMDGEEHSQKRAIIAPEFVGRKLDAFLPVIERNVRDLIVRFTEKAAKELVERFIERRDVDLVDAFSTRLPVNVIVDMLALPQSDHDRFHYWYRTFLTGLSPDPVLRKKGIEANAEFHDYLDPFVQERLRNPGDDLISKLCMAEVDGARLTIHDIKSFISLLLTAGGETTDRAIANLWWLLLNHPKQLEHVREDHSLIDQAFTETMRCEAPVGGEVRLVMRDWDIGGVHVPMGDVVNLSIHSANHDEQVFASPEKFDIFREDLYIGREMRIGHREEGRSSHIGFGLGKHFCVGYQLARTEAVVGTAMLFAAIGDVRLKPGHNPVMGGNDGMRSVTSLEIQFDSA
ncbi:MAG TPA: cytochrome P450 [Dehalococcoidia bacterium]|nr:cytochrome P450 [Dehalococcoidia bacterium]